VRVVVLAGECEQGKERKRNERKKEDLMKAARVMYYAARVQGVKNRI